MLEVGDTIQVDPASLHVSPSRLQGADPGKLQLQISRFGRSCEGMPSLWVGLANDGELVILNGMTRATRMAKLSPGTLLFVTITEKLNDNGRRLPTIGERLP